MSQRDELDIPDAANRDMQSFELLRVWIANKEQHVSLKVGVWEDPAAWGIVLADLAGHVANSYQQDAGFDPAKTLNRIRAAFDAELTSHTDKPVGSIKS